MTQARPDTYAELRLAEGKLLGWDERKKTASCAVQPRDAEILTALARYRFLTTAQIAELWWSGCGMRAVRRRMTQLFEAGLVERFRPQTIRGAFQWTYCLTSDGFRAAQQSGELPAGLKFTPRRERLFDFRYVIHDLRVNEWVIRYRRLAGENVFDWSGPDEALVEPPHKLPQEIPPRPRYDGHIGDIDRRDIRPIQPDARLDVIHAKGDLMMFVEYDRTRRVDKNYDKFRRYEAFLTGWWHLAIGGDWQRPAVVFVCQDQDHQLRFLRAADYELVGYCSPYSGGVASHEYPARERILFALEEDVHQGGTGAMRVPPWPPDHPKRTRPVHARRVNLPGLHED
ncbi:MAG TPA: replication-relaxation family protein [Solirubrobacteraceae bacterium]|nr:replication-relaxation family protein [Solirubrobacteraceae bacterium]